MAELQEHEIQEIIDTYARTNHTVRTAEITHHSTTTVWKYLHERGLCQPRGKARLKMTDAQLSDAIDAGLTRAEIAEKFDLHITNIDRRMRNLGKYARHAVPKSRHKPEPLEWHTTEGSRNLAEATVGDRFEYIAYKDRRIKLKCKTCGRHTDADVTSVRRARVTCQSCKEAKEKALAIEKLATVLLRIADSKTPKRCVVCGCEFCTPYSTKIYCSDKCSKKAKNRRHTKNRKRRGIKQAHKPGRGYRDRCRHHGVEYVPGITLKRIYARDKGICQICGKPTDWNDKSYGTGAGPLYPSIDHIIALANGGGHTLDNFQLAHHLCNALKSDKEAAQYAKV